LFGDAGCLDRSFLCMTASLDGDNVPRPGSAIFSNIRAKSIAIEIPYQWIDSFPENIPRWAEDGGSLYGAKSSGPSPIQLRHDRSSQMRMPPLAVLF
jgi:hypothetical protein